MDVEGDVKVDVDVDVDVDVGVLDCMWLVCLVWFVCTISWCNSNRLISISFK